MHGYGFEFIGNRNYPGGIDNIGLATFCCALFSPCTYCFMFISGWYGMKFSTQKYLHFAFMAMSCFFVGILIKYFSFGSLDKYYILTHIFPIADEAWWFLTYYVFVLIISPFINLGFEQLPVKTLRNVIIIMTFLEIANCFTLVNSSGSTFYGLLYIYMLARYLRTIDFCWSTKRLLIFYLGALVFLWLLCYFFASLEGNPLQRFCYKLLSYNNPLIIVMAVTVFLLVLKIKPTYIPVVNKISANVLYVYLLTEMVLCGGGMLLYIRFLKEIKYSG